MSNNDFITSILNINEVDIERIQTVNKNELLEIELWIKEKENVLCPSCLIKLNIHGYTIRKIKHSALNNRDCIIFYHQRRYRCKECGSTYSEDNPFSDSKDNLSYETKINILKDLKYPGSTYSAVAKRNGVSITTVQRLFEKCVNIKRKPLPRCLSIDEHYFPSSDVKGSSFICVLMDFETGEVIDILPDRKKKVLYDYFYKIRKETLSEGGLHSELDNVKYVSIDMYDTYKEVAETFFKGCVISADPFHVLENLTRPFKHIKNISKGALKNPNIKYLFNKFRFIFNHDLYVDNEPKYNKKFQRYLNLRDIRSLIFNECTYLKTAFDLKELYMDFNDSSTLIDAEEKLNEVIKAFKESGVIEYEEFTNTLIKWKKEIVNSFTIINGKRLNNSYIESKNRIIERLMYNANGFINFKRTRNRFLYSLNKHDKYTLK